VERGRETPDEIVPDDIDSFMVLLAEQGHSKNGVAAIFAAMRLWENWLLRKELTTKSPVHRSEKPVHEERIQDPTPRPDLARMLEATAKSRRLGRRDRALLLTLLDTGGRVGEILQTDLGDLNLDEGTLTLRHTKTHAVRTAFLSPETIGALKDYLAQVERGRARLGAAFADRGPLFVQLRRHHWGKRATYDVATRRLAHLAREAGVPTPLMHGIRRQFAYGLLKNGASVVAISRLLGHADLATTSRYLKLTAADLREAHSHFSPVLSLRQNGGAK
jgi:site-specific recombinase XerD